MTETVTVNGARRAQSDYQALILDGRIPLADTAPGSLQHYQQITPYYLATDTGRVHSSWPNRYERQFGYDSNRMIADLGWDVHPVLHGDETHKSLLGFMYAQLQARPRHFMEQLSPTDLAAARLASVCHKFGGGRLLFAEVLPVKLRERARELTEHEGSYGHVLLEANHLANVLRVGQAAGAIAIEAQQRDTPLTPRIKQLTRLAKHVLPIAIEQLGGYATQFPLVEKRLEQAQPLHDEVMRLPNLLAGSRETAASLQKR
jgi:hypothetical protein